MNIIVVIILLLFLENSDQLICEETENGVTDCDLYELPDLVPN